jgi:hypothetical protein
MHAVHLRCCQLNDHRTDTNSLWRLYDRVRRISGTSSVRLERVGPDRAVLVIGEEQRKRQALP